ncbi:S-type pyocin domain-containing protein [Pseudomonas chlororaphis]|uniref:S-type pyocin domain-containing protein n=1 Tax=Pseudomonas chlororaphis TaxID=587753 RepID=UPI000F576A87|nr:S-type pyocin domain-containing protein [Pseudomonas chlororaphis]
MKEKARLEKLLHDKRRRAIKEPPPPKDPEPIPRKTPPPLLKGCVFAKSCTLPNGVINHSNPGGFVPVESLKQYGTYAVMGTGPVASTGGTALQWIGGSGSASALLARLRGTLALAGPTTVGFAALLLPNDTSTDSAFYTSEQYAQLSQGNTRVRVNVKHLPDGSVSVYGFYTGTKTEWQQVPVIKAKARGDQLVADIGNGIEVIWTPAADPKAVSGIPALEGVSLKPGIWVYPPTEQADKILVNPEHPPDYQDAIIWFPTQPNITPIYLSLSVRNAPGVVSGGGEDVSGVWLAGASSGLGAPIPTSIADQLRGRKFSSFDSFRRAFWVSVSRDPELSSQFLPRDLDRMRAGKAPRAREVDMAGRRQSHEIHHVELISEGGEVYNVNNLRVNTPKNHVEVHQD